MLINKRTELLHVIELDKPDIICLSEILPKHSKYSVLLTELQIKGYDCFTNINDMDCKRGVAVYTKDHLCAVPSKVKESMIFTESAWCEIALRGNDRLYIGGIYRSPNSSDENNKKLNDALASISNKSHVLIMGDFNHPEIDWTDETSPIDPDHRASRFMEAVRDSYLIQHVKAPTHFRGEQKPNTLDLIFTNEDGMVKTVNHLAPLGKSHHQILTYDYHCYTEINRKKPRLNYNIGNYDKLRDLLSNLNWSDCLTGDLETSWDAFLRKLNDAITSSIPLNKNSVSPLKNRLPLWTNERALVKVKKKREAFKRYLHTREGKDYLLYAQARNQAKHESRKAVQIFESKVAQQAKTNPKAFFAYAKSKLKTRDGIADLEDREGNVATSDSEKAQLLNAFFCSVFTREDISNIPDFEQRLSSVGLTSLHIEQDTVLKKLKALKTDKSPGPDGFHPRVLKEAAENLAEPLTIIFRKSVEEGKLPQIWKDANVTPIFKKGDKNKPGNYRPVSLTCILCKMLESLVRDEVISHMTDNNLLSIHQHGFISGRSTSTNLLKVMDAWTEALDAAEPVDAIYLDFAKAFDSVPHERLIHKLHMYGIQGEVLAWIEQFLKGRRQRVRVNESVSTWEAVTSGIPQGSVLGPVLFVIFINDLPECVNSLVEMFADDTKIYSPLKGDTDRTSLQQDLHSLTDWAKTWQLRFNETKCKTLHLGNNNPNYDYAMRDETGDEVTLETTELEKDLGVHIDPSLKFSKHTEIQVNKANRILGLIRRSYQYLDCDCFKKLFTALVRPHLEYGIVVWAPRLEKDKNLIEGVLRRGTKLIPGMKDLSYEERLKKMDLPSMSYRRERGDMIEAYKYTHDLYLTDQILHLDQDNTRRGHNFKLKKRYSRTSTRKHFFSFRVVDAWNYLPRTVVNAPSLNSFKARLDKIWTQNKFVVKQPSLLPQAKDIVDIESEEEMTSSQA